MPNVRKPTPEEIAKLRSRTASFMIELDKSRMIDVSVDDTAFTFYEGPMSQHPFGKVYNEDFTADSVRFICGPTEQGDPSLSDKDGVFYDPVTDEITWLEDGDLHHPSGPAVINLRHQHMFWYQNGMEHNSFGPGRVQLKERRTLNTFLGTRYPATGKVQKATLDAWKKGLITTNRQIVSQKATTGNQEKTYKNLGKLIPNAVSEMTLLDLADTIVEMEKQRAAMKDPVAKKQQIANVMSELNKLAKQEVSYLDKEIAAAGLQSATKYDITTFGQPALKAAIKSDLEAFDRAAAEWDAMFNQDLTKNEAPTKPAAAFPKQAVTPPYDIKKIKTAVEADKVNKVQIENLVNQAVTETLNSQEATKVTTAPKTTTTTDTTTPEVPAKPSLASRAKKVLKADGKLALYRIAANQTVQAVQLAVVAFMTKDMKNKREKEKMSSLILTAFKSEEGAIFLAMMLGVALPYIAETLPEEAQAVALQMAQEFRVKAMADAGTKITNAGIMVAYEQLSGQLGSILAPVVASLDEREEEEETATAPAQRVRAVAATAAPAPPDAEHAEAAHPAKSRKGAHA